MIPQNVTQKTAPERLNALRSPEETPPQTKTHIFISISDELSAVFNITQKEFCRTERREEDRGGDEEAEHQADHDHAGHDRAETPPAHHQEDAAHYADHSRQRQTDCRRSHKTHSVNK